jgi:tetratricopeptide (TPR) repeat protein/DNA-binding XRE family transcriptional regulator
METTTHSISSSFGTLLKAWRKRQQLTQQELAQILGAHRRTIVRWEQGDYLPTSRTTVLELARHLKLHDQETRQLLEASLTALVPHWYVPLPRNPYFTGREEILAALHTQLDSQRASVPAQSCALSGLGGVGKTQIALEYAYRHALEYSAVFWVEADTAERITSSLLRLADVLDLPERYDSDQQQVLRVVQQWLTTHHHWLLIWDNLEDPTLLYTFVPPTRHGVFLITTQCATLGTLAQGIELLPLKPDEGLVFLLHRAKILSPANVQQMRLFATSSPTEYAAAQEVVICLGGLPLALDQVGAYIDETRCGFLGYLQRFEQQRSILLDRRGAVSTDHPQSVVSTFLLACQQVAQRFPTALELLRLCALLSPDAIPEQLLLAYPTCLGDELSAVAADPLQFDQALEVLLGLSLIHRYADNRTLSMHRLVQVVVCESMSEHERTQRRLQVLQVLARFFSQVTTDNSTEVWKQCERLLPHALLVSAALADHPGNQDLVLVLSKAADLLRERAQYDQAQLLYERALRICNQEVGQMPLATADVLNGLANLYAEQGSYAQAEQASRQALHIQEQTLGVDHPETSTSFLTLAGLFWLRGEYTQAEPLYCRVLALREQVWGEEHPLVILPLSRLGLLYWRQGKYEQAEPLFQRALALCEQLRGPEQPQLIEPLTNLGLLYWKQGRHRAAESLFRRAIHIWEQVFGPEYPGLAYTLTGLASVLTEQGKHEEAERLFQRALHIRERALGAEHHLVAVSLNNLAEISMKRGKLVQAERLYLRAIALYEHRGEIEHRSLAHPLHGLANLSAKLGKKAQAELLYQRALQIWEQVQEYPEVAMALSDLAHLHQSQGSDEQAERLFQRALAIQERYIGPEHPDTAHTLHELASLYRMQGRLSEAISLVARALAVWEQTLGDDHTKTLAARSLSIQLLQECKHLQEEEPSTTQPAGANDMLWTPQHPPIHSIGVTPRDASKRLTYVRKVRMREVTFTCTVCGQTVTQFHYPSGRIKYCSEACRAIIAAQRHDARVATQRGKRRLARAAVLRAQQDEIV